MLKAISRSIIASRPRAFHPHPCHQLNNRQFHATRPNLLINEALAASHGVFQAVHTYSGLSWGFSIPLTAVLFRLAFLRLEYLADLCRKREQIYAPLLIAWRRELQRQVIFNESKNNIRLGPEQAEKLVQEELQRKKRSFQKQFRVKPWHKALPLCFLPVWVSNVVTLNMMCGGRTPYFGTGKKDGEEVEIAHTSEIPLEPAFTNEGFFTFPDLSQPDPMWVLPLTLWAVSIVHFMSMAKGPESAEAQNMPRNKKVVQAFGKSARNIAELYVLVLGPVIIIRELPAAVVLFWLTGSVVMAIQRPLLKSLLGLNKNFKPVVPRAIQMKDIERRVAPDSILHKVRT